MKTADGAEEREADRSPCQTVRDTRANSDSPKRPFTMTASSGKHGNQLDEIRSMAFGHVYHFKRFISSTLVEILPRKTTMMMASPTAASPGRDGDDEQRDDLAGHGLEVMGKCDEIDIRRIQHDLNRHQDDDEISPISTPSKPVIKSTALTATYAVKGS